MRCCSRNWMNLALVWMAAAWVPASVAAPADSTGRLRVIIETDAGGDPDDEQSLVRGGQLQAGQPPSTCRPQRRQDQTRAHPQGETR